MLANDYSQYVPICKQALRIIIDVTTHQLIKKQTICVEMEPALYGDRSRMHNSAITCMAQQMEL